MKNAIREFLDLKDSEKADLWNNATFVFDTNVYLDLYRYSQKTRTVLLEAMSQLSERIWMPNHVAHEFMKDRVEVIFDTINRHETMKPEIDKIVKLFSGILRFKENEPEVMQLRNQLESWVTSNEEKNLLVKDVANDPVLDKILTLYEGKVGTAIDETELEKIKEEGKARYEKLQKSQKQEQTRIDGEISKQNKSIEGYLSQINACRTQSNELFRQFEICAASFADWQVKNRVFAENFTPTIYRLDRLPSCNEIFADVNFDEDPILTTLKGIFTLGLWNESKIKEVQDKLEKMEKYTLPEAIKKGNMEIDRCEKISESLKFVQENFTFFTDFNGP